MEGEESPGNTRVSDHVVVAPVMYRDLFRLKHVKCEHITHKKDQLQMFWIIFPMNFSSLQYFKHV